MRRLDLEDPEGGVITLSVALTTILLLLSLAGCGRNTHDYPVTEQHLRMQAANVASPGRAPPVAASVDGARLAAARREPHNWLTYYGAYDGQRFSPLDQVTNANVRDLRVVWAFQHGVTTIIAAPATYAFEATPLVVDGVMFVSGSDSYVWALDAVTGRLLWTYHHAVPLDTPLCCGNVNRGVAVAAGKVFLAATNGHLVALDATTGREVWDVPFADVRSGESATAAPLVVKELVIVGSSGGEYGTRGHIDAFDLQTGARAWRRYTIPKPGEPGSETWEDADRTAWQRGGGAAWITGTYDPELDLLYWGTSNPGPVFDGAPRPGANLFTNSVLALDPDDGAIRWHYQWTPHDVWDYDGVSENILFEHEGRKLLGHFDKNGYFFVLDRTDGRFVRAAPFARATWGRVDPASGAVTVSRVPTPDGMEICPGPAGAKEWSHGAFSPRTQLLYVPVVEKCGRFVARRTSFKESLPYLGGDFENRGMEGWGHVKAVDPATGREAWSWRAAHPMVGSLLVTGGDVLFGGEPTGHFNAYDARTGELRWQFQTGSGIRGSPITYSVNGKQYVAVPSGWGGWVEGFAPELYGASRGQTLFVFALP
jgi:alcohol dehydrogenase (cytochrome c)